MLAFPHRHYGFTLVEVIVAIGIFSILSVGCYRIVNGIINAQERVNTHSEKLREISRAIRIIESDFQQIIDRKIIDNNGNLLSAYITDLQSFTNEKIKAEFTRTGYRNPLFSKRANVVRVSLGYQDEMDQADYKTNIDKESGYLIRSIWPVLDRGNNNEPEKQILLAGVLSLDFEYLDANENWISEWPPLGTASQKSSDIPYAIKLKITMDGDFTIERVFAMRELPI